MISAGAPAKINLALVVGPTREDGLHEVATILQRLELHDTISLEPAAALTVEGFEDDSLVRRALESLAAAARIEPGWRTRIEKRIPVAAGLGGGSSDAATAIRLANDLLEEPLPQGTLRAIARGLGVDVAFFLEPGPQLGLGDGSQLQPAELPQDYSVLLLRPTVWRRAPRARSTVASVVREGLTKGVDASSRLRLRGAEPTCRLSPTTISPGHRSHRNCASSEHSART